MNFKPNFPGAFYDALLECYVYPTTDAYDEADGPPWNYSFPEDEIDPSDKDKGHTVDGNPPSPHPVHHADSKEVTKGVTLGVPEVMPIESDGLRSKENALNKGKRRTRTASVTSNSQLLSESKSRGEPEPEALRSEHGYCMKVNMSRLNEGQEINFMVTPISDRINMYELPDMLLSDEEIAKHLRQSNTTSSSMEDVKKCLSQHYQNLDELDVDFTGDSSSPPSEFSSDKSGQQEKDSANISTNFPSIHPSKLILPGNDQTTTSVVLDGMKGTALPLCITFKVTGTNCFF